MQKRILNHLMEHNILVKEQYGFRTNLKTDNATYHLAKSCVGASHSCTSGPFQVLTQTSHSFTNQVSPANHRPAYFDQSQASVFRPITDNTPSQQTV